MIAKDYESLGFGHGFATSTTSICTLADTLLTARGGRSRWFGPKGSYSDQVTLFASNLDADTLFTDIATAAWWRSCSPIRSGDRASRQRHSCAGTPPG